MAAEGGNNITWFTYTGAGGEVIPRDATHVFVYVKIIPASAFRYYHNIIEVICHDEVEKIEEKVFYDCHSLRRVIMRGAKIVGECAFYDCEALTYVECGKLETIEGWAFIHCRSLRSINLPSARIVGQSAFAHCQALAAVTFGNKLERFDQRAFWDCTSLERITIPLKDGIITDDNIFQACGKLKHIDLIEGALHETIAALHFEELRNEMNAEINSINQVLPNISDGFGQIREGGGKAQVIRRWIRSVLDKISYCEEHQRMLDEAVTVLQLALPRDIVMNDVLSFLALPPHSFGVEDHEDAGGDGVDEVHDEQQGLRCVIL